MHSLRNLFLFVPLGLAACAGPGPKTIELASGAPMEVADLNAYFDGATATGKVPGLAVAIINDSEVVYHHVSGVADLETGRPVTKETIFEAASLSKPAFGALVVSLDGDGVIDLDTPLATYMPHPDLEGVPEAQAMTARHVLTHQTGLPNWRTDMPDDELSFAFAPGEGYRYSGEGYEYLADVLMAELELDEPGLDALFLERFATPYGVEDLSFIQSPDIFPRKAVGYKDGVPAKSGVDYTVPQFGAAYSIHAEAMGYAKLLIVFIDGPAFTDEERETFLTPQNAKIPADDPQRALGLSDWALGFSVYEFPGERFFTHGGNNPGYSSLAAINPETGWGFVIFTNQDQANAFLQEAIAVISGLPVAP